MNDTPPPPAAAAVVLSCRDLDANLAFFVELGFALDSIRPADAPRLATLTGFGLSLALERADVDGGGHLRLPGTGAPQRAPNGARVDFAGPPAGRRVFPPPVFVASHVGDAPWTAGRAGMHYRDLVPDRQGGALIASHIRIATGGPVPDYVHYHEVDAQVIHCVAGRVRVVYEDQGEPFVLEAGDTVLQPPGIRHRVLECSDGLEVVEVTAPAEHATCTDRALALPTATRRPDRTFAGQRFVRHRAAGAPWRPWDFAGFAAQDTGVAAATGGAVAAQTVRPAKDGATVQAAGAGRTRFWFVQRGAMTVACDSATATLGPGDACLVPARASFRLAAAPQLEWFEVALAALS